MVIYISNTKTTGLIGLPCKIDYIKILLKNEFHLVTGIYNSKPWNRNEKSKQNVGKK